MTESTERFSDLPEPVERMLDHWPLPTRADAEWEAMAEAIEDRILNLTPGDGEGDDWLFQPPLPLVKGEPRRFITDSNQGADGLGDRESKELETTELKSRVRVSDHRSLKEIAEEALLAKTDAATGLAPETLPARRPAESGVQFTYPWRAEADPLASANPLPHSDAKRPPLPFTAKHPPGVPQTAAPTMTAAPTAASSEEVSSAPGTASTSKVVHLPRQVWLWSGIAAAAAAMLFIAGPGQDSEAPRPVANTPVVEAPAANEVTAEDNVPAKAHLRTNGDATKEIAEEDAKTSPSVPTVDPSALDSEPVAVAKPVPRRLRSKAPAWQKEQAPTRAEAPVEAQEAPEPLMVPAADLASRPARPSNGAALAAIGPALGAARLCVVGHLQPSQATVTFGSDGHVRSVKVSGPAAGTPADDCIQKAMMRSRVSPFSDESFSVRTTVRP